MKKLLFITGILLMSTFSFAQTYQHAIGLKGLSPHNPFSGGGINFKTFIGGSNALDITLGGGNNHLTGQLLYEWQRPTGWTNGFDWYLGIGGTLGAWNNGNHWHDHDYDDGFFLNADAVIGLDFNILPNTNIPLGFAVEAGPSIGIINSRSFGLSSAVAVRYIIR